MRLLTETGVAGRPQSWFRRENRAEFAADWRVDGADPAAFVAAALVAGRSANGVFGLRVMGENFAALLADLQSLHPGLRGLALLTAVFGRCLFILLQRQDGVAQAVSRLRAEQTRHWHTFDGKVSIEGGNPAPAVYDFQKLATYLQEARTGTHWLQDWFVLENLAPIRLTYEALSADPQGVVRALLGDLALPVPGTDPLPIATGRLADALNTVWAARFRAEGGI